MTTNASDIFSGGACLVCGHAESVHGPPWLPRNTPTSYAVYAVCSTCLSAAQSSWEAAMKIWKAEFDAWRKNGAKGNPPKQPVLYTMCEKVFLIPAT